MSSALVIPFDQDDLHGHDLPEELRFTPRPRLRLIQGGDDGSGDGGRGEGAPVAAVAVRRESASTYRRRRLLVATVAIGLVLGAVTFNRAGAGDGASGVPAAPVADVEVTVQPGDTLWSLVADLVPGQDPRPVVAAVAEELGSTSLQAGQRLVIPGHLLG